MKLLIYLAVTFAFTILVEWQIEVRKALAPGPGSPPPAGCPGSQTINGLPRRGLSHRGLLPPRGLSPKGAKAFTSVSMLAGNFQPLTRSCCAQQSGMLVGLVVEALPIIPGPESLEADYLSRTEG